MNNFIILKLPIKLLTNELRIANNALFKLAKLSFTNLLCRIKYYHELLLYIINISSANCAASTVYYTLIKFDV